MYDSILDPRYVGSRGPYLQVSLFFLSLSRCNASARNGDNVTGSEWEPRAKVSRSQTGFDLGGIIRQICIYNL